jgi:hypothetical protein
VLLSRVYVIYVSGMSAVFCAVPVLCNKVCGMSGVFYVINHS